MSPSSLAQWALNAYRPYGIGGGEQRVKGQVEELIFVIVVLKTKIAEKKKYTCMVEHIYLDQNILYTQTSLG